jgi:hypothetical protein
MSTAGHLTELEGRSSTDLRDWYRSRFQPRLARAVRLGLVEPDRAAALDNDLRALIGADLPSTSREAADRDVSETTA